MFQNGLGHQQLRLPRPRTPPLTPTPPPVAWLSPKRTDPVTGQGPMVRAPHPQSTLHSSFSPTYPVSMVMLPGLLCLFPSVSQHHTRAAWLGTARRNMQSDHQLHPEHIAVWGAHPQQGFPPRRHTSPRVFVWGRLSLLGGLWRTRQARGAG